MKKDMYGFTVKLRDKEFTSEQFRTLCEYESVTLSIYSDGFLMISLLSGIWLCLYQVVLNSISMERSRLALSVSSTSM
jgi:hypothetical protein